MSTSTLEGVPRMRLFHGPDSGPSSGGSLCPTMSLCEFFEAYFCPVYLEAVKVKPTTVNEYRTAIGRWAEITGDPPLSQIDARLAAKFVAADARKPGRRGERISPNTIRKHCVELQMILKLAGPRSRDCRLAATEDGLFGFDQYRRPRSAPWFNPPPVRDKLPTDCFTLDEIRAWLAACEHATRPAGLGFAPGLWWQCLVRFLYNSGLRIGSALDLRRAWVHQKDGISWAEIPSDSYKQGRPHLIYLAESALAALSALPTSDLVFPWPHTHVHLQHCRISLLKHAGLPPDRLFGFHGLRKALASQLWQHNRQAAALQLGHADGKVTEQSYAAPWVLGQSLGALIGPAMEKIEQP